MMGVATFEKAPSTDCPDEAGDIVPNNGNFAHTPVLQMVREFTRDSVDNIKYKVALLEQLWGLGKVFHHLGSL